VLKGDTADDWSSRDTPPTRAHSACDRKRGSSPPVVVNPRDLGKPLNGSKEPCPRGLGLPPPGESWPARERVPSSYLDGRAIRDRDPVDWADGRSGELFPAESQLHEPVRRNVDWGPCALPERAPLKRSSISAWSVFSTVRAGSIPAGAPPKLGESVSWSRRAWLLDA
jgi:hypothetical protein